jgi:3-deoxy-7-phosphoheptulonate synthase
VRNQLLTVLDPDGLRDRPPARRPDRTYYQHVTPAAALLEAMPLGSQRAAAISRWRGEVRAVLDGADDRLLVISGPCSVHDPAAAVDYARWLAQMAQVFRTDLLLVMRAYFEKPRTVTGWKGLISDPGLDDSHDMDTGLHRARMTLLEITDAGVPCACEWLDPLVPPYIADAVTWGAIGARTTESQVHRQIASALPMPTGFKNSTSGSTQVAVDACAAAAAAHTFLGSAPDGGTVIVTSPGNRDCHPVLRGGHDGPNYTAPHVEKTLAMLAAAGLPRRVVIDASHANSGKDYRRQQAVAGDVAGQVAAGQPGIVGVMLESFIRPGRQEPGDLAQLTYGQSVTDACMDLAMTADVFGNLAAAIRARRGTW